MKKTLMVGAMSALLALGGGCAAVVVGGMVAGVGGYAYVQGEVKSTEPVPIERAWKAVLAAVKDLGYPIVSQSKDALSSELTARNPGDKKIVIKVTKRFENSTEIGIRVGSFGDEALSGEILDKIRKRL